MNNPTEGDMTPAEKCQSNECEIRDTCTGHAWCTGERKRAPDARTPRPPEELVDALQDRIHPASGRLLAAKPIKMNNPTEHQPQAECDIDEIMLDGCVCPCGCGERGYRVLKLGQNDTDMVADGVADAIMELEAWAEWWIASVNSDEDAPLPAATGKIADAALEEEFRRNCRRRERRGTDIPWQALYHLEAAAILRDGWRPK